MTETATVQKFPAGQAIPPWLLDHEPNAPGATPANLRFLVDCDVIETERYYVVHCSRFEDGNTPPLVIDGGHNNTIYAPSKPVIIPRTCMVMIPQDMDLPGFGDVVFSGGVARAVPKAGDRPDLTTARERAAKQLTDVLNAKSFNPSPREIEEDTVARAQHKAAPDVQAIYLTYLPVIIGAVGVLLGVVGLLALALGR